MTDQIPFPDRTRLRPSLRFGALLLEGFRILRARPFLLLFSAALLAIPLTPFGMTDGPGPVGIAPSAMGIAFRALRAVLQASVAACTRVVLLALCTRVALDLRAGDARPVLGPVVRRLPGLLLIGLVTGVVVVVATQLFVVPGLIVAGFLALLPCAYVAHAVGPFEAFSVGIERADGRRATIFVVVVIGFAVWFAAHAAALRHADALYFAHAPTRELLVLSGTVSFVTNMLVSLFLSLTLAAAFVRLTLDRNATEVFRGVDTFS